MLLDILIIVVLILFNGVLAMTELAVVSSKKSRLQAMADKGNAGAKVALQLKENPVKFLSTVQGGITLIGIFSGAYSGVTFAGPLAEYLKFHFPLLDTHADDIAIGVVVGLVTYLSLVIGELVPKQMALRYADAVAVAIARPIYWLAIITKPVVMLLDFSARLVLGILRISTHHGHETTEDDVKAAIAEGAASGSLEVEEKHMIDRVMRLNDISITSAMTHRKDIIWFDVDEDSESALRKVQETRHARYPLCEKSIENVVGVIVIKDVLLQLNKYGKMNLRKIAKKPLYLPDTKTIFNALEEFKQNASNMAIIIDEYGALEGIVTHKDIMEIIVGNMPEPSIRGDYNVAEREDGSWLVDAGLSVHELEELTGVKDVDINDDYTTVAGFIIHQLKYIPKEGEMLTWRDWRFEVVDMDGARIDKVIIHPIKK